MSRYMINPRYHISLYSTVHARLTRPSSRKKPLKVMSRSGLGLIDADTLHGRGRFTLRTDNDALSWSLNMGNATIKLERWILPLSDY